MAWLHQSSPLAVAISGLALRTASSWLARPGRIAAVSGSLLLLLLLAWCWAKARWHIHRVLRTELRLPSPSDSLALCTHLRSAHRPSIGCVFHGLGLSGHELSEA